MTGAQGWRWLAALLVLLHAFSAASAAPPEGDITRSAQFAIDAGGRSGIEQVAAGSLALAPLAQPRAFALAEGDALWMRFELPALDPSQRWYLRLAGSAFLDRASLFQRVDGHWVAQQAGELVPVNAWAQPDVTPLFAVRPAAERTVWLRVENRPAPASAIVHLLSEPSLHRSLHWTLLLVGAYLGFGLLVFVVGLIHARLYGDRVFHAYCLYVACMLGFQLAYTGVGGLFFWPGSAAFNDAAPPLFMLCMVGTGIWFIREATALPRHAPRADRAVVGFALFGPLFAGVYLALQDPVAYAILNVYGLLSVLLSIGLCLWTWRRGEAYSGWLLLGFLPIHLTYPFPALRAAGVLADNVATQYAVLLGSAIEIPLLLYILHRRAKDFSEHHERLRALDSTDALTGLPLPPVLRLRLRDALRRARRSAQRCAVLLVDLANHEEVVAAEGREAGDRVLVVAASRLAALVREVDTVCRVAGTRFAILVEGPLPDEARRSLAQHIVARGLERVPQLPSHHALQFRVVTAWPPDPDTTVGPAVAEDEPLLQRLHDALDQLLAAGKVVQHLDAKPA